jgi:serine/threonine/tyrosine-interacting protein
MANEDPRADSLSPEKLKGAGSSPMSGVQQLSTPSTSPLPLVPVGSSQAHHEYSFRLPTGPRILVPPPTVASELPALEFGQGPNSAILENIALDNVLQENTLLEWAYEQRRQAQMVLPMLYLGPMNAAKDPHFLQSYDITLALAVRSNEAGLKGAIRAAQGFGVDVETVEVPRFQDLAQCFARTNAIIDTHLERTNGAGKVLVFCESGNEKSATVVAAYLMHILHQCNHIKAIQVCQTQRFCVNFDDTLKNILLSYWDVLSATRDVNSIPRHLRYSTVPSKRGFHEVDSEDFDNPGSVRTKWAPFFDME